jgi:hypothetical protein
LAASFKCALHLFLGVYMIRLRQLRVPVLMGFLALASLRCSENTDPPVPSAIEKQGGDAQVAPAGTLLPNALSVLVTDDQGDPAQGVSVTWSTQGGSLSASTSSTGSNGQASVQWTLGPQVGEQLATASVDGLQGSPVTFTATASDVSPTFALAITTNPPVSALDHEVFDPAAQPVVVLTDGQGNPVAGEQVTASIASGDGVLDGTTAATTSADGVAAFGDLGISGTGEQILQFTAGEASVTASPTTLTPLSSKATSGEWGPIVPWDIVPLHMGLMPSGKIFTWGKTESPADTIGLPRLWDPATGPPTGALKITVPNMLFCAGLTLTPDGQMMLAGGHHMDAAGIKVTYFFDQNGSFIKGPDMHHGRWYPTLTVLPDGRILSMAGRDESGTVVRTPEIWEGGQWVELPGAGSLEIPYYPRNFVDPKNGSPLVFYASERVQSRWFNPDVGSGASRGSWSAGPTHVYGFNRDYGSAVMYDAGKILVVGGGGNPNWGDTPDPKAAAPTATAEKIDLNQLSPTWLSTGSMALRRRHMNATVLPDGQVLATGGTSGGGFVNIDPAMAAKAAEIWNPGTGQWTTLAANQVMRVYHSVSMLLPDGTVLHGASGDALAGDGVTPVPSERNHEIFSPPYLFKGSRPTITSAPATVNYGTTFSVSTPNAAQITDARWIRLGAVTHAFDNGGIANTLTFTPTATGVDITAPAGPNIAPPGYYMVFILNRNGVPSAGKVVKVQ